MIGQGFQTIGISDMEARHDVFRYDGFYQATDISAFVVQSQHFRETAFKKKLVEGILQCSHILGSRNVRL